MWSKSVVSRNAGRWYRSRAYAHRLGWSTSPLAGETPEWHRDQVETHQLHVEEQVSVGDGIAGQEAPIGEWLVEPVECGEHPID